MLDFPSSPSIGQTYPASPVAGVPTYKWDGEKWSMQTALAILDAPSDNILYGRRNGLWVPAASADALGYYGMQVNGSAQVDQAAFGVNTVTASMAYFHETWQAGASSSGAVFTAVATATPFSPVAFPWAFDRCVRLIATTRITTVAAGDYALIGFPIEGYRLVRCGLGRSNGSPITVAFWAYSDIAGTASMALRNGPSITRSCVKNFTLAAATPTYVVLTFPPCPDGAWNTDNSVGMRLDFCFACGTTYQTAAQGVWVSANVLGTSANTNMLSVNGNGVHISGLIVLAGNQAPNAAQSPNALRQRQEELLTCQRYWYKFNVGNMFGYGHLRTGGTASYVVITLPTPMRVAPAMPYPGNTTMFSGDSSAPLSTLGSASFFADSPNLMLQATHATVGANGAMCQLYNPTNPFPMDARL